jgi:uncharacterized protein (DUF427 family)
MVTQDVKILTAQGTWVVRAGGAVIGESARVLELIDGSRPADLYFPRADLAMAFLEPAARTVQSRGIGEARYFDLVLRSATIPEAAWSYEAPLPTAERIAGHVAFAPGDRVTIERL